MLPVGNCSSLNSIEVRKFYFMLYELPLCANLISINIVLSQLCKQQEVDVSGASIIVFVAEAGYTIEYENECFL